MSKLALDKFLSLLERSKLIEDDRRAQVVDAWKQQASLAELDDAQFLADHLIRQGLITEWQSHKLFDGRHRGFYLGKYKLLDHLGSGGMSNVYLAQHVLMQRRVAIKVLPHNRVSDATYLAQFHVEAQAAAALDHRNIVRAFDLDCEGRIHYLVMEYVEGRDLHAVVSQDGPLDYHTAANFIVQAAAGLQHAHQRGLVHRDIKPANLLVDREGVVKVLDMGLAKFTSETRATPAALAEHVLGTADYLAPEQAVNSQTVDHRADIYALGCTFYYLLTGHPPFVDGTSLERMTAHRHDEPPSLLVDRPDAPAALVAICQRMMKKSPGDRYASAEEVRRALAAWLESESAAGRVDAQALAVAARATPRGGAHGAQAPAGPSSSGASRSGVIGGATSDLPPPPPEMPPPFTSALQDTDLNLHRATIKMPTTGGAATPVPNPLTESHVLRLGAPGTAGGSASGSGPLAPPVIAPPLSDSFVLAAPPIERPHGTPVAPSQRPASSLAIAKRPQVSSWRKSPQRFWVVLISTMIITALMLLIATSSR